MINKKRSLFIKGLVTISFLLMIIVNVLANVLPINGITTGEVAEKYKNLFTPAGITFAIWGLIYFLLAGYTLYQLGFFGGKNSPNQEMLEKVGLYFSVSSIANAMWLLAWHYDFITLSMVIMLIILIYLIFIVEEIQKYNLSNREKLFVKIPFSIYFGWITIATIGNAAVLLKSLGWNGFGISEVVWTVIVIIVGLLISVTTMLKNNDIAYGLVIIWAYIGILIKHISSKGFDGQYPAIIITTAICIIILLIVEIIIKKRKVR